MAISGKSATTFGQANYATLRSKKAGGEWKSASTNEEWELFWCEVTDYDGETVALAKTEGRHEIQEDSRGEYIQITQEHNSIFASGEYETRLRPYIEDRTETKPWMDGE
jgi:hypothetical protein